MVLKISAPCVSDGSGNPVIANKTKCSVAICFYFTDCFFRASYFIAMTDWNGQRGFFCIGISFGKKTRPKYYSTFKSITYFPFKSSKLISVELEG